MMKLMMIQGAAASFLNYASALPAGFVISDARPIPTMQSYNTLPSMASTSSYVQQPMQSYTTLPSVASTSSYVQQPMQSYTTLPSMASTSSYVQQQSYTTLPSMASTSSYVQQPMQSYTTLPSVASTSSYVQQPMQYTMAMESAASTSSYVQQPMQSYTTLPSVASTSSYVQPQPMMASGSQYNFRSDIGSNTNPYWAENLKNMEAPVLGRTMGAFKGAKNMMVGEKHVVHNDLKVLENLESDKTIFTKKIVHHSPILHKKIRTHEIAQDNVHEKFVHHLNTVEDQWKNVPGQEFVAGESHVDHRTEDAPAPSIIAKPMETTKYVQQAKYTKPSYSKFGW